MQETPYIHIRNKMVSRKTSQWLDLSKQFQKSQLKNNNIVETVHLQLTQAEETVKIP